MSAYSVEVGAPAPIPMQVMSGPKRLPEELAKIKAIRERNLPGLKEIMKQMNEFKAKVGIFDTGLLARIMRFFMGTSTNEIELSNILDTLTRANQEMRSSLPKSFMDQFSEKFDAIHSQIKAAKNFNGDAFRKLLSNLIDLVMEIQDAFGTLHEQAIIQQREEIKGLEEKCTVANEELEQTRDALIKSQADLKCALEAIKELKLEVADLKSKLENAMQEKEVAIRTLTSEMKKTQDLAEKAQKQKEETDRLLNSMNRRMTALERARKKAIP